MKDITLKVIVTVDDEMDSCDLLDMFVADLEAAEYSANVRILEERKDPNENNDI